MRTRNVRDGIRGKCHVAIVLGLILAVLGYSQTEEANAGVVKKATATPTATPTSTPRTKQLRSTPGATPTPCTTTSWYVSPEGSDSNYGSEPDSGHAWRTLQYAVDHVPAGGTIFVATGSYGENVSITSSGGANAGCRKEITSYDGGDPITSSFTITASYWTVDSQEMTNQANLKGIYVDGSAAFDTISNNYVHELCRDGIFTDSGTSNITVSGNRVYHAQMSGITISGANGLVVGNEIWYTLDKPWLAGGIYSSCIDPYPTGVGDDADYVRYFGSGHVISANNLHDIPVNYAAGGPIGQYAPHTDCFQTWNDGQTTQNILIERNRCIAPAPYYQAAGNVSCTASGVPYACCTGNNRGTCPSGTGGNQIGNTAAVSGTLTFQDNLFTNLYHGIQIVSGSPTLRIWNNTFDHIALEAVEIDIATPSGTAIKNNIFYDCGDNMSSYLCAQDNKPALATNVFTMRTGSTGTYACGYKGAPPFIDNDPRFVDSGTLPALNDADYHLQSESPDLDNGVNLPSVTNDYYGVTRPCNTGNSIGAACE
ncbi:MAG: right-handed parallel beta-helix repeat-containing protein [Candidatus Binataceae bacterium]|jgi:hypothetical protein